MSNSFFVAIVLYQLIVIGAAALHLSLAIRHPASWRLFPFA
jgi:hypothetical protein